MKKNIVLLSLFISFLACAQPNSYMLTLSEQLRDSGICTGENYQALLKAVEQKEIHSEFDIIRYFNNVVILNAADFTTASVETFERLHRKTAAAHPDLSFTDFEVQYKKELADNPFQIPMDYALVSLQHKGKKYQLQNTIYLEPNNEVGREMVLDEYYQIFNKILANEQSPYQLHRLDKNQKGWDDPEQFAIVAFTEEQANMLQGTMLFSMSAEFLRPIYSSKQIEAVLDGFKKSGVLEGLSPKELILAKEKIERQAIGSDEEILTCFPNLIYCFDVELGNIDTPYEELIQAFSRISRGAFYPLDLNCRFEMGSEQGAFIEFNFNTKHYQITLDASSDYLDSRFIEFMNFVAKDNSLPGRFYQKSDPYSQELCILYLTETQASQLGEQLHIKLK
ncbi:MAG: hypothetical protein R2792_01775 [Saprospiraceae bacterium]